MSLKEVEDKDGGCELAGEESWGDGAFMVCCNQGERFV